MTAGRPTSASMIIICQQVTGRKAGDRTASTNGRNRLRCRIDSWMPPVPSIALAPAGRSSGRQRDPAFPQRQPADRIRPA